MLVLHPNRPSYGPMRKALEHAAGAARWLLAIVDCAAKKDFHAGALVVTSDPLYLDRHVLIIELAAAHSRRSMHGANI